jgi:hypothetical protein
MNDRRRIEILTSLIDGEG